MHWCADASYTRRPPIATHFYSGRPPIATHFYSGCAGCLVREGVPRLFSAGRSTRAHVAANAGAKTTQDGGTAMAQHGTRHTAHGTRQKATDRVFAFSHRGRLEGGEVSKVHGPPFANLNVGLKIYIFHPISFMINFYRTWAKKKRIIKEMGLTLLYARFHFVYYREYPYAQGCGLS